MLNGSEFVSRLLILQVRLLCTAMHHCTLIASCPICRQSMKWWQLNELLPSLSTYNTTVLNLSKLLTNNENGTPYQLKPTFLVLTILGQTVRSVRRKEKKIFLNFWNISEEACTVVFKMNISDTKGNIFTKLLFYKNNWLLCFLSLLVCEQQNRLTAVSFNLVWFWRMPHACLDKL